MSQTDRQTVVTPGARFISSTLAAQLQLVKDEKRFAEGLFQYILPDVTHDASEESKSARVRKFLGNVFKDGKIDKWICNPIQMKHFLSLSQFITSLSVRVSHFETRQ